MLDVWLHNFNHEENNVASQTEEVEGEKKVESPLMEKTSEGWVIAHTEEKDLRRSVGKQHHTTKLFFSVLCMVNYV